LTLARQGDGLDVSGRDREGLEERGTGLPPSSLEKERLMEVFRALRLGLVRGSMVVLSAELGWVYDDS
jgi:hypothetical protein